ncbi:ShlB/FhaC/HecB family hemolysin secretion/activation protein [Trichocoleus desertorum AS-A10]|uniref:ShlB/FhaC/HecB family hemolysin secretion/activation protein n=1 Tax=Trichocoleus desertorum TaxID=1481672 RepID=UPI003297CDF4
MLLISSTAASPLPAQAVDKNPAFASQLVLSQASFPPPDILEPPSRNIPTPETPQPSPVLPPPEELLRPPASSPDVTQPQPLPDNVPATITVERFEVVGSTVFSSAELTAVTQAFTQRPISLAELFQARSALTQLYVERGYITSGAYIPPQQLRNGVVTIQIVEGTLEEIIITGTRRLKSTYVQNRLAIATQQPLNRDRLLEALQLLQLNPLIESLSAELSAGTRPGENLLEVRVTEAETFNTQITLDNGRSPSVGTFRRRLQLSEANLLGLGDSLSAAYTNTAGSNSLDASYTLPLNARNGTLNLAYGTSSSQVIEEPFDQLDIDANSRYYELTLRQPLVETPREEFAIGLTASRRESQASLLGGDIPFPALGADEQGKTHISALRFFQEWTRRSNREVFAARSQFSLGLDALNATLSGTGPDSRFFSWRGQGQWVRLLAPDTLLLLRTDVQLAERSLVPLEQFGLGGLETVRGYRQDLLLADNGLFASAEVRLPVARIRWWDSVLQLTPFVDFGTAWNRGDREEPDPNTLASVGLGLRWQMGDRLTARLDWGIPLVSVDVSKETLQENGLYFSILYNPF